MDRLEKAALLSRLSKEMREKGSWCGETHLQKAVFILQELFEVPMGFEFVLYKHGPFSFELRDELTALRADEIFKLEPQAPPYGPRLSTTEFGEKLQDVYREDVEKYIEKIRTVSTTLGMKGVAELEGLATAFYLTKYEYTDASADVRAEKLNELKPHIPIEKALSFVSEVDHLVS